MDIEMHPVESSMLSAVGYDGGVLFARYKNGRVYQHAGVPQEKFDALMSSASKGEYFNLHIKGQHPAASSR